MNKKISNKERGLIKGALRRVFSRSDLRKQALSANSIKHSDPNRPRVTRWSFCDTCGIIEASYLFQVDHLDPLIPINKTLENMSWDEVIDRLWCELSNLSCVCIDCHKTKSKLEQKARSNFKKGKSK